MPSDMSEASESLAHVDLSGITSLEGNLRVLAFLPKLETCAFEHCPSVAGDLKVFEHCPKLRQLRVEGCEEVEGSVAVFHKCPLLEHVDLTNTGAEGSVAVFEKLGKAGKLRKAKLGGTKCYEGLPPNLRPAVSPPNKRAFGSF